MLGATPKLGQDIGPGFLYGFLKDLKGSLRVTEGLLNSDFLRLSGA